MGADPIFPRSIFHLSLLHENACVAGYTLNQEMSSSVIAGGGERDPGGAKWTAAESAGLRRRKAMSTSGWLGDRTRPLIRPQRALHNVLVEVVDRHPGVQDDPLGVDASRALAEEKRRRVGDFLRRHPFLPQRELFRVQIVIRVAGDASGDRKSVV